MGEYSKKYISIKKNREFQFLFKKGTSVVTYAFACYFRENKRRFNRCGIVTSKKIGNAVKRNRSRRLIKEAFRLIEPGLRQTTEKRYDFIFVARSATPSLKCGKVQSLMRSRLVPLVSGQSPNGDAAK